MLSGILAGGHVLLEDFPGLGKTLAARSFAQTLGLRFTRAQFTPDLLPADLTGSFVYDQRTGEFAFRRGPLFTGLLLADEINRTPPKTQAALLEAMQERQVTVEGETFALDAPFHVLATANPVEYEGTYPLPEAQLDRFMLRISFGYPTADEEWDVLHRRMARHREEQQLRQVVDAATLLAMQAAVETVTVDESIGRYCVALTTATRAHPARADGIVATRVAGADAGREGPRRDRRPRLRHAGGRQAARGAGARPPRHGQAGAVDEPRHGCIGREGRARVGRCTLGAGGRAPGGAVVSHRPTTAWRPTAALVRSVVVALSAIAIAALFRRADLLVIGAPFAVIAGWSVATRPRTEPEVSQRLADHVVREGDATTWSALTTATEGMESVVALLSPSRWIVRDPLGGAVMASAGTAGARLNVIVRPVRWGQHLVGPAMISAGSAWGAFRCVRSVPSLALAAQPLPTTFDAKVAVRHTHGLVGLDRSAREGEGNEFAGIRAFQVGDRMRRINWPRSLRVGTLQVVSTWADQDTHVAIEVDATKDVGVSGGIDGAASSIDITVRAAAAIADHYLHRGDRVSLRVFGSSGARPVPPASGQYHLRRVLDALTAIRPGSDPLATYARRRATGTEVLVVMLSPLVSITALERAATLAQRGVTVAVIDTLPQDIADIPDPVASVAWRIRRLERRREVRTIEAVGVPVIAWRGPGSLDQFLRDLARRASAPRLVRR